ncbi:MAG: ATP-binding protein [Acutalibacteraceae bacterium]
MKLLKCYINNFGKLSDFSYSFNDKLTVINEENGFGKSTLCAFIKAMFYGFNSTKTKKINENERLKFMPWQSGVFGGYLDFSVNDREYRIERSFGQKASEDVFSLYNLKNGSRCDEYSDKIGEELFGVDIKGFERCTCFSNIDLGLKVPTSVAAKISSLIDNTDDLCDYDAALSALVKRSRQYQTIGNKGIIPETKASLSDLQNELYEISKAEQALEQKEKELEDLKNLKASNEKELENIRSLIFENAEVSVIKQKIKHYNSLVSMHKSAKEKAELLENKYGFNMPDEDEINNISKSFEKTELLKTSVYKNLKRKVFLLISAFLWVACAALIGTAYFLKKEFSGIFIPSIAVLSINFLSDIVVITEKLIKKRKYNKQKAALESLISKYNFDIKDFNSIISEMRRDLFDYKRAKIESDEYYNKAREYYKNENLKSFKENLRLKTPEELKLKENEVTNNIDAISEQILTKSAEINKLNEIFDKKYEVLHHFEEKQKALEEYNQNYEAILKAIDLIKQAKENLSVKYKSKTENVFKNTLKSIADEKIEDVLLSSDFDVLVSEKGILRDFDSFSSGTKAVIEIAFRLSLADVLFEKEKPFLILDDPFVSLDDTTFKKVSLVLKKLSHSVQIIYFTCSKSRNIF